MAWIAAVILVVALVVSFAMQPKPQNAKPVGLGEFTVPTAEVGREIPVLFGRRKLEAPNVVWYGHLASSPVKKKP